MAITTAAKAISSTRIEVVPLSQLNPTVKLQFQAHIQGAAPAGASVERFAWIHWLSQLEAVGLKGSDGDLAVAGWVAYVLSKELKNPYPLSCVVLFNPSSTVGRDISHRVTGRYDQHVWVSMWGYGVEDHKDILQKLYLDVSKTLRHENGSLRHSWELLLPDHPPYSTVHSQAARLIRATPSNMTPTHATLPLIVPRSFTLALRRYELK